MSNISFGSRLKHAWNSFFNKDPTMRFKEVGAGYFYKPDHLWLKTYNERSIVNAVYNRIALDVAAISIRHVRIDDEDRFLEIIKSGLDNCLSLSANIDQSGTDFIKDAVLSMFDEGHVALVPVDTTINPLLTDAYDILTMRTGKIIEWYPSHVKVNVYNEKTAKKEDIILPKRMVSIIENPFYSVMNEHNSVAKRLVRKLDILDVIDEQSGSGKLDLIIQLPYVVRTQARKEEAERRMSDIEQQLANSKYGIAYTDGTERVVQLNRPVENNLMSQIEYLTNMLYSQLGITQSIMDGTADEKTMLNYMNRTVIPIVSAIAIDIKRKFLTKTARSQNQSIMYFSDPFKLVPVSQIAEIADKFTRNEILTANEVRQIVGYKPSDDPGADELRNKNIAQHNNAPTQEEGGKIQNEEV